MEDGLKKALELGLWRIKSVSVTYMPIFFLNCVYTYIVSVYQNEVFILKEEAQGQARLHYLLSA